MLTGSIERIEKHTLNMLYFVKERTPEREPIDVNEVVRETTAL